MLPEPPPAPPGLPGASCVCEIHGRAAPNTALFIVSSCSPVLSATKTVLLKPWQLAIFFPLPTLVAERLSDL